MHRREVGGDFTSNAAGYDFDPRLSGGQLSPTPSLRHTGAVPTNLPCPLMVLTFPPFAATETLPSGAYRLRSHLAGSRLVPAQSEPAKCFTNFCRQPPLTSASSSLIPSE